MSRTSILVNVGSQYNMTIADPPTRGSDWAKTVTAGAQLQAGTTGATIGSIGDPAEHGETNHWGWIFFTLVPVAGGIPIQGQLFIEVSHSSVVKTCLGAFEKDSSESKPCPGATFGTIEVETKPPTGKVLYSMT